MRFSAVSAVALTALASPLYAQFHDDKPRVSIAFVGCDDALLREAQRIAAIELRATLVAMALDRVTTQVTATCLADVTNLHVRDPTTGKSLEHPVALSEAAPSARARLLALAIAELVVASWSELEKNPEPNVPPAAPRAPLDDRKATLRAIAPSRVEIAAVAEGHLLASRDLLLGGGARIDLGLSKGLFARADALAHYGELSRPTGSVSVTMTSLAGAVAASLEGALRADLSLGARIGYLWMTGAADNATTLGHRQRGPWFGPELTLSLVAWPRARINPALSLSAGVHILGLKGTVAGGRDVEATGVWGALGLAVALR